MTLDEINNCAVDDLSIALRKCCGATKWIQSMIGMRPYTSRNDLQNKADISWSSCVFEDVMEAFNHHPKIGDKENMAKNFSSTKEWAGDEQRGVDTASDQILERLLIVNEEYVIKYGYIFIVYATGKSAVQMLDLLESRLHNDADAELKIAKGEQHKITKLRLNKLLKMSQITTHVLDTARGMPAEGILITLQKSGDNINEWTNITSGTTNTDGRIPDFVSDDMVLSQGKYRMLFETESYFLAQNIKGFYPYVPVVFEIYETSHYHIPLLLSPFGYSTYRGS